MQLVLFVPSPTAVTTKTTTYGLVKFAKNFKISRHIESLFVCMEH